MQNPDIKWHEITEGTLNYLRISSAGLLLLLLASLMFAANVFTMTIKWKIRLAKSLLATITASPEAEGVKS